jgi:hypothetical protein
MLKVDLCLSVDAPLMQPCGADSAEKKKQFSHDFCQVQVFCAIGPKGRRSFAHDLTRELVRVVLAGEKRTSATPGVGELPPSIWNYHGGGELRGSRFQSESSMGPMTNRTRAFDCPEVTGGKGKSAQSLLVDTRGEAAGRTQTALVR